MDRAFSRSSMCNWLSKGCQPCVPKFTLNVFLLYIFFLVTRVSTSLAFLIQLRRMVGDCCKSVCVDMLQEISLWFHSACANQRATLRLFECLLPSFAVVFAVVFNPRFHIPFCSFLACCFYKVCFICCVTWVAFFSLSSLFFVLPPAL